MPTDSMQIHPSIPTVELNASQMARAVSAWKVGQLLEASVLHNSGNGQVQLQINGQRLQAQSQQPLIVGQKLQLKVASTGKQVVLEVRPEPPAPQQRSESLRQMLPLQRPLAPLLNQLQTLSQQPQLQAQLPEPARALISQLVRLPLETRQLADPTALRGAVQRSGLFLEAMLARGLSQDMSQDFKAALLRLLQVLKQPQAQAARASAPPPPTPGGQASTAPPSANTAPPQTQANPGQSGSRPTGATTPELPSALRPGQPQSQPPAAPQARAHVAEWFQGGRVQEQLQQQVESALARLQLNQVASTPREGTPVQQWALELPVRLGEQTQVLDLHIEEGEADNAEPGERPWSLTLAIDLDDFGPFYARIGLRAGEIGTTLWAEQEGSAAKLTEALPELRLRLEQAGLKIARLDCLQGKPSEPTASGPQIQPILDTQA